MKKPWVARAYKLAYKDDDPKHRFQILQYEEDGVEKYAIKDKHGTTDNLPYKAVQIYMDIIYDEDL